MELRREDYERGKERIAERNRESRLRKVFGMSVAEYQEMLTSQGSRCAICKKNTKNGQRLSVDHDHATGKVRGLLCVRCNYVVGWVEDTASVPDLLNRVARYLVKERD
jgi:hypothetical protein